MSHLSTLISTELPSETTAVQQKTYVTFTCIAPGRRWSADPDVEPTVTLLERRHLISGSLTTGFRTWEAALHLGSYLLTAEGISLIRDKSVLELGAGTGFLSILCARHLEAKHVTATDGDEGVVEALRENLFLNGLDQEEQVVTSILRWGRGLTGTWVEEDCDAWQYDTVIGADIVSQSYQSSNFLLLTSGRHTTKSASRRLWLPFDFCSTCGQSCEPLYREQSARQRRSRPFVMLAVCQTIFSRGIAALLTLAVVRNQFAVEEVLFNPKTRREQTALFYATAVPLKILMITRPN